MAAIFLGGYTDKCFVNGVRYSIIVIGFLA
jgi:hypothetical protein